MDRQMKGQNKPKLWHQGPPHFPTHLLHGLCPRQRRQNLVLHLLPVPIVSEPFLLSCHKHYAAPSCLLGQS